MRKFILIIFILFGLFQNLLAVYVVNENCKEAWMLLMDLKIEQAKKLLADEIRINPENYYAYYLDQTCDAYKLLINSSEEEYDLFLENYDKKREIMDEQDEDSPYYLACYAEMELQIAIFNIIYGSRFSGLTKGYSAYNKAYRNLKKHPDFKPSLKLDGFFNVAISNLPPFVKWAVSFFGVSVDFDYGFKVLQNNYTTQKNVKGINAESALFIILAAKVNKTPELVYEFTKSLDSSISQTFIHQYFKANIAYRTGRNEEALTTMQQIDINDDAFADIIYSYMMGKILLRKLDPGAEYYLSRYLSHLEKKEYVKEMNYNLAIVHLLNNDVLKYNEYTDIVKNEGMDLNERDREALYDAKLDYPPNIHLVKARLLIDGSYIERFEIALNDYETKKSGITGHQLEYLFLKARYNAIKNNNAKAIKGFNKVIALGEDEDYYFACEAALRLGYIHEKGGNLTLAKEYYKKSIKLYKSDFYEYIEDKAIKAESNL